ncbi:MAG: hypothetical protein CVU06_13825, partial [Bacteroidetes bacterium HGW-Bacteroidetes-22]
EENLLGVDYVIPDYTYLIRNQQKIKALIITHGHEDHIGGIPFLMQVLKLEKIYAPRFAKGLINRKLEERRMQNQVKIEEITNISRVETKYFKVGFFFTEKTITGIHELPISQMIKDSIPDARPVGRLIPLSINVEKTDQTDDLIQLVNYKKHLK